MEQLETKSKDKIFHTKIYESPTIKQHFVEAESLLKPGSTEKTVKDGGMQEKWTEEELTETFTWTW